MFNRTNLGISACILASLLLAVAFAPASHADVVAQWNFASDADLLVDSSGNGNTLVIGGATVWSDDAPAGSGLSGSVLFDGTSATMETADIFNLSGYSSLRLSWWQKFTGTSTAGVVFQYGENLETAVGGFSSVCDNNNKVGQGQITLHANTGFSYDIDRYVNLEGAANDTWEHMQVEIDLLAEDVIDVIKIWQDGTPITGTEVLTANPADFFAADEKMYIGYRMEPAANPWYFNGKIAGLTVETLGLISHLPGDANRDFVVNGDDAVILAANWMGSGGWGEGDFNDDGIINDIDATILATNWQSAPAEAAVPEPGMIALILCALSVLCITRRRSTASK